MTDITIFNRNYNTLLNNYGINTPLRRSHFFTQLWHESRLKPVAENLNYSASGLLTTFRKYFDNVSSINYARQPQKIANRVYANRMGNGSEASGDGWKYRGRGFIQLTGKNNYILLSKDTRIDFLNNPDLLLQEANSMIAACWFWHYNKINEIADKNDLIGVRKKVNGGIIGLKECQTLFSEVEKLI